MIDTSYFDFKYIEVNNTNGISLCIFWSLRVFIKRLQSTETNTWRQTRSYTDTDL
jgi:hypothetical protein